MLLRDHPLFKHRGVPSWPPTWTWVSGTDNKQPIGEIGILRDVYRSKIEPADRCFLYMDFNGASYLGCLLIDERVLPSNSGTAAGQPQQDDCGHWQLGPFVYFVEY